MCLRGRAAMGGATGGRDWEPWRKGGGERLRGRRSEYGREEVDMREMVFY